MKYKKKKNNKRSAKNPAAIKEKTPAIVIGLSSLFLLVVFGLGLLTYNILCKSNYFYIRESRMEWLKEPLKMSPYNKLIATGVGKNIFKFDIGSVSKEIKKANSELKNVKILKNFPNALTLKLESRVPVAQVGDTSFFLVDDEGVILTETEDSIRDDLPIITGIGWRLFRKMGERERSPGLLNALSLIDTMDKAHFSDNHILTRIDVSGDRNMVFLIEDGLEVKIGNSNFRERLILLDRTLGSINGDKSDIKYVDLRFDDVVLGTK
ncbi:MAG: cell division protein FtsQ [Candidatus Omnitrophica bacterium]|nr:cell division protein FtsQ [Candidatus Omnitrophota bacterium]